jgi:hypothetical protein
MTIKNRSASYDRISEATSKTKSMLTDQKKSIPRPAPKYRYYPTPYRTPILKTYFTYRNGTLDLTKLDLTETEDEE